MKNSPIVVLKFGSSVLCNVVSVPRAVNEIYRHVQGGERVIAVVSALAQVRGENNMLRLEFESGEELTVTRKGAGRWPTSESVFSDLMEIFRYRKGV